MNNAKKQYRKGGFTFKQFFVAHDRCAMKVGTDGVLLGAWAPLEGVRDALDIGCGSGLIALMLAQRSAEVCVDAIELDSDAAKQAQDNFDESIWANRLRAISQDVITFSENSLKRYDLIVSNPPYFEPAVACRDEKRDQARYTGALTHEVLLECAKRCLAPEGIFCVVLPYEIGERFQTIAQHCGWFTAYRIDISDKGTTPKHRMLLGIKRVEVEASHHFLVLKEEDGQYTEQFQALIRPFYLKY